MSGTHARSPRRSHSGCRSLLCTFSLLLALSLRAPAVALAAVGDLDPTFSGDGKALTRIDGTTAGAVTAVAIQPDGRIVVVGGNDRFTVVRYRTDGSIDTSFGGDGIVEADLSPGWDVAKAVAVDEGGRIVVAGVIDVTGSRSSWVVLRYDERGRLDPGFGGDGRVTIRFSHHVLGTEPTDHYLGADLRDLALGSDGTILLAGTTVDLDPADVGPDPRYFSTLVRLDSAGSPDHTFGHKGKVFRRFRGFGAVVAMVMPTTGRILLAVNRHAERPFAQSVLFRYDADGAFRGRFGDATTEFGPDDDGGDLAVAPDGAIVAVGTTYLPHRHAWSVTRYRPDGSLDPSFSRDGMKITTFAECRWQCIATGVAVQPDGAIVVVGRLPLDGSGPFTHGSFGVVRYRPDGRLDRSFGGDGRVFTDLLGSENEYAHVAAVALQADGKIVAAGDVSSRDLLHKYAVVRFISHE